MNAKQNRLIREQIDSKFKALRAMKQIGLPHKGWIRAIRDALGLSGSQLGKRLGCTRQWISLVENNEITGNVTLNTMHNVADALDCIFVYGLIPKTSLEDTITKQVRKVAQARIQRTSHTMRLEKQELSDQEKERLIKSEMETILGESTQMWWREA